MGVHVSPHERESRCGRCLQPHELADRYPEHPAYHPCAYPRDASRGRPGGACRQWPVSGRAHPRCNLRGDAGNDHVPFSGDQDAVLDQIEMFLTGTRRPDTPDKVLATILVVEIVESMVL